VCKEKPTAEEFEGDETGFRVGKHNVYLTDVGSCVYDGIRVGVLLIPWSSSYIQQMTAASLKVSV
jgi:hypothetical protein